MDMAVNVEIRIFNPNGVIQIQDTAGKFLP